MSQSAVFRLRLGLGLGLVLGLGLGLGLSVFFFQVKHLTHDSYTDAVYFSTNVCYCNSSVSN